MNILKIIISFLLLILPIAVLFRDWRFHDKSTKKQHAITRIIIIFWFISSIASTFFIFSDAEKLEAKNERIIKLLEENQRLNNEISGSITGGDSYCYFFPSRPSKNSNILDLLLMHKGVYPLYDVTVKIDDVEKMIERVNKELAEEKLPYDSMFLSMKMLSKDSQIFQVGNLAPNTAKQLAIPFPADIDKKSYNVSIIARNGSLNQTIRYRRIDNNWKLAMKVTFKGEIVQEHIDEDFPRNKEGKIEW